MSFLAHGVPTIIEGEGENEEVDAARECEEVMAMGLDMSVGLTFTGRRGE